MIVGFATQSGGSLMLPPSFWSRAAYLSRCAARLVLVLAFVAYAATKLAGTQFAAGGSDFDRPFADLSGIQLTFMYFGYSPLLSQFVAVGELAAAALLAFDRTARLGSAVLLPILTTVVVINFGHQFDQQTKVAAVVLYTLNLYLIAWDLPAWWQFFWTDREAANRPKFLGHPALAVARGVAVAGTFSGFLWFCSVVTDRPGESAVRGEWVVESVTFDGRATDDPTIGGGLRWVCFDPSGRMGLRTNRGTLTGRYETADGLTVRYDPEPFPPVYPGPVEEGSRGVSEADLKRVREADYPGHRWPVELAGKYRRDGDKLVFTAVPRGRSTTVTWVLTSYRRPRF